MGKQSINEGFVLLLILVAMVGVVFLYSEVKLTGMAILEEYENQTSCEDAGHFWYNSVCNSEEEPSCSNDLTLCLDETNCTSEDGFWYNSVCNSEEEPSCSNDLTLCLDETNCTAEEGFWYNSVCNSNTCTESWTCADWGTCSSGTQARTCTDTAGCNTTSRTESQNCTCVESWSCGSWGTCSSGTQARTCTDEHSCGTIANKPSVSQTCTVQTSTSNSGGSESNKKVPSTTKVATACTPEWTCGEWENCINGTQIRACTDSKNCGSQKDIPATTQNCVEELKEETGVATGQNKGFLTLVGSVVKGPISFVSGIFTNRTKTLIFSGVVVLIIGGFIAFKFFFSKQIGLKKLDKIIDNLPK